MSEKKPEYTLTDILILGAGTAGLSAAIYGARAGCKVIVIESNMHGGQIINTAMVENYPAISEISGFDFAQSLYKQAKSLGVEIVYQKVESFKLEGKIKEIITNRAKYQAKAVIIATGSTHKKLAAKGEDRLIYKGISFCATCDGAFFKDKNTMVIGGGNTALGDAIFLSNICAKVYLVHRRNAFRGEKYLADKVIAKPNIEIIYDSGVDEFIGEDKLTQVRLRNFKTDITTTFEVDGAFIAVGQTPQTEIFKNILNLNESNYFDAGEDCKTNLEGVWCAGDCREKVLRQLVTAAADGAIAGSAAAVYINN